MKPKLIYLSNTAKTSSWSKSVRYFNHGHVFQEDTGEKKAAMLENISGEILVAKLHRGQRFTRSHGRELNIIYVVAQQYGD